MSCRAQFVSVPPTHVFSLKDATNWNVLPLTSPMPATDIARAMAVLRIECITPDLDVQFGYRTSDDMMTWGAFTSVGSTQTSDGITYPNTSSPINALFVEFCVRVKNSSGDDDCASALVSLSLELSSF